MPGEIQTSFIPKSPMTGQAKPSEPASVGLMTVIGLILALASTAVFGGALIDQAMIKADIAITDQSIAKLRAEMPLKNLQDIERLNASLNNAKSLLAVHVSASRVFDLLQSLTVPTVRYTNFNFSGATIKVKGLARTYEDIAAEAEVLKSRSEAITKFDFADFTIDQKTKEVLFNLTLTVAPEAFRYVVDGVNP